ncbi:citrate synthase [Georgenia satyanarayanai]|uniref:citrate/2-methylcitrate synthase n=1 Tax=Georgenia satyanarayanai TaxID=860221 RepID=UPI00203C5975|nr:citrate/2-methylcitrate synthase [Georgenia satyanarayanai]MCM3662267.1 citrate synthase [Georgenia satyanarayanai]
MDTTPHRPIFSLGPDDEPLYRDQPVSGLLDRHVESVWGLLVDDVENPALPPAEPFPLPVRTGDTRVDVQSAIAQLAPVWGFRPLLDITPSRARDDLARASVLALSFVAQSARGPELAMVPQHEVEQGRSVADRFLIRWRGDTRPDHARALDALWTIVAEDGPDSPSTLIARTAASTGADVGACLAGAISGVSGPLAAGAAARARQVAVRVHDGLDPATAVDDALREQAMVPGLVPRERDRRAAMLREVCRQLDVRLFAAGRAIEEAGRERIAEATGRPSSAGVNFWGALLLDHVGFEARLFNALIVCGRTAGWSAHILEAQKSLHP